MEMEARKFKWLLKKMQKKGYMRTRRTRERGRR